MDKLLMSVICGALVVVVGLVVMVRQTRCDHEGAARQAMRQMDAVFQTALQDMARVAATHRRRSSAQQPRRTFDDWLR